MSDINDSDSDSTLDLDCAGPTIAMSTTISRHSAEQSLTKPKSNHLSKSTVPSKRSSHTITATGDNLRSDTRDRSLSPSKRTRIDFKSTGSHDAIQHQSLKPSFKQKSTVQGAKKEAFLFPPDFSEVDFSDDERIEKLDRRPCFSEIIPQRLETDIKLPGSRGIIPAPISQWLRDYQIHGVAFLHKLFAQQRGGILGDDMGLGKTVQVIAFLTAAFGKTADSRDSKRRRKIRDYTKQWYPRVLLVCPGSLIENWKEELDRWGWWDVQVFHGSSKARDEAIHAARYGHIEIMITTCKLWPNIELTSAQQDLDNTYLTHQLEVNEVDWDCVIADECHCLKGKKSQITAAMNEVNARCRIGLTGTAIQNDYDELWSLLHWSNPSELGSARDWSSMISEPLKQGQSHDATLAQLGKARLVAERLVHNLLPRFFLRRTKLLIADQLPRKFDRVVFCPLTQTQIEAYKSFLASDVVQYIKLSGELCDCGSEAKRGWCCYQTPPDIEETWRQLVFPSMLMLSKLSNHIALLLPNSSQDSEKQRRDLVLLKLALPNEWKFYYQRLDMDNHTDLELFGKWKVLRKLLAFWEPRGDKVLVFSHSTRLLDILRVLFTSTSYTVCYLDGKMSLAARAAEVAKFNSNPDQFIFCISTKAGGVGLNITSANKVIIMDPNWNPAYDLQAQDRAFRIGQRRDVEVFRLISSGTIEETIYARQIYKQQQAAIAYTASNERRHFRGVHGSGERGDIFGLGNLFTYTESLKLKEILDKTEIAENRAGINVASIDIAATESDAEDDENAVMSQYANAFSRGKTVAELDHAEPKSQPDPVQAILSQAGIAYTHSNRDTLGSSRIESELSAQARQGKADPTQGIQKVFRDFGDAEESDYKWRPSEVIRKRQFRKMAKEYGEDVDAFAVRVENWTAEQRRIFLDDFYNRRNYTRRKN